MKVLLNSFHLNGYTLGFHPQTLKLGPHLLTQGLTLGVKGLTSHCRKVAAVGRFQ